MSIAIEQANAMMSEIFAPWIQQLAMEPVSVSDTEAVLRLPANEALRHVGGVICGPPVRHRCADSRSAATQRLRTWGRARARFPG